MTPYSSGSLFQFFIIASVEFPNKKVGGERTEKDT